MAGVGDIFKLLATFLPPWALGLLFGLLAAALFPFWLRSMRIKQIKGRIRRMNRADEQTRQALADEAMGMAAHDGHRLVFLALEARKMNEPQLLERALETLAGIDGFQAEVARLRSEGQRKVDKMLAHPVEIEVVAERLLTEGAVVAAGERVDEGLQRFPNDPALQALKARIATLLDAAP